MRLHADWAAELGQLLLQFKNAVAPIDDKELWVRLAWLILAVAEPIETFANLAIPGCLHHPVYLFDVPEQVESKIYAHGHLGAMQALFGRLVLEHCLHGHNFMITVRTTVLNQLLVNLISAPQIGAVHALVPVLETSVRLLVVFYI